MKDFWDLRYKENDTVYGNLPNHYFKSNIDALKPASILLPAEGEGRNAIYAAAKGWDVSAFDYSDEAMSKAKANASEKKVQINYTIVDIKQYQVNQYYEAIGLIYVHLPPAERVEFHQKMIDSLKPGGTIILEAFSKEQMNHQSGGPRAIEQLYSISDLIHDFKNIDIIELEEIEIVLDEGPFHQGKASVIRMIAKKPS